MSPSEKRTPPSNLIDTSIPTDLPPSYEHTILPPSNPWTDTPSSQQQPTQQQTQQAPVSIPSQNPFSAFSRLTTIPFSKYRIRDSKLSDDQTTITTTSPELTATGANATSSLQVQRNLTKFVHDQASLPPKPIMIVRGTHLGSAGQHGSPVVDFELKFNLTSLLDLGLDGEGAATAEGGGSTCRSGWKLKVVRYQHGSSNGSPKQLSREERNMSPLELWVKKFCEDKAENRSFTLTRQCPNLPTALLEGHVRNLLASTKYRGKLTIDFSIQSSSVIILRKSSNWFTNMLRLYPTKKYEVINAEWPVAGTAAVIAREGADVQGTTAGSSGRPGLQRNNTQTSTNSELQPGSSAASTSSQHADPGSQPNDQTGLPALVAQAWWREWHFAIWNAVLSGKKGWVTVEDWIEAKMGLREKERLKEWGVDYE